jgi:hypothetical protein
MTAGNGKWIERHLETSGVFHLLKYVTFLSLFVYNHGL